MTPSAQQAGVHRLNFTGVGWTYFRIWIVNLLLTLLTLGIYSAWAKVRSLRYLYGNTLLDGSPFEFHGSPLALLRGRILGVSLLLAYSQSSRVSLTLWLAVMALLALILPWLLWKSLRFRLANTSYRGLRFGFGGSLGAMYAVFLPPLLGVLAYVVWIAFAQRAVAVNAGAPQLPARTIAVGLGIFCLLFLAVAPWFWFRLKRYQQANAHLGLAAFSFEGRVVGAYGVAGAVGAWFALSLLPLFGGAALGMFGLPHWGMQAIVAGGALAILGYLSILGMQTVAVGLAQNFIWNHSALAGQPFRSVVRGGRLWALALSNLLATLLTLGLFWPFALMRQLRYRLGCVAWTGDPAALVAGLEQSGGSAVGEESADLLGLDLAL